jgi:glutamate-1-semialdehyde 2,1-aminomutase
LEFKNTMSWHERASKVIPGGVNSAVRSTAFPVPHHYTHAKDARLWDVDGNEYIDYILGQGPMLFGHTPECVIEAITRQAEKGILFAGQGEDEVIAAELLVKHIPCAEMVRFSSTGSESVHAAIRLARSATGRDKILRFEGHYHGWLDTIAWNGPTPDTDIGPRENPRRRPSSRGQLGAYADSLVIRPWNDLPLLEATFAEQGSQLAAVICDPFASASGIIPADRDYLTRLRDLCTQHGTVLIFDEVITGFRVHPGGAQAYFEVTPDLAIFAKALGGGLPIAALAGRADLMMEFTRGTVHSGTYNASALVMAGTRAALEHLYADNGAVLDRAHDAGRRLSEELEALAEGYGLSLQLRGVNTVFSTSFVPSTADPITDMRSAQQADSEMLRAFRIAMQENGVQLTSFGIWFVSTVHDERDIDETLEAARKSLAHLAGRTR